ncbi:YbjN domain-containing protein [Dysgonomonas sp. HDW5B]|uniref:YbjN domain-containing protein n=1 Tax=Dysgonomonas sp. HDW5B TaxID=2714927 RepID=UPI00140799C8|nr:YbjN domain-containing protein [Dysgonomonas sp. HDW5B]QIK52849.1 YbjN domain-containing protein [Dysgonomonas sp. HDW5B]
MNDMYFKKIETYILKLGYSITYHDGTKGVFCIESEADGIKNLIIGVAPPILIIEQFIFTLQNDDKEILKSLLIKNRDIIHGGFVLNEDGTKVIFRYTMQIENMGINEFEGALNSLGLLLSEYYEQIIEFAKK